jgi:hypothetical protein
MTAGQNEFAFPWQAGNQFNGDTTNWPNASAFFAVGKPQAMTLQVKFRPPKPLYF